MQSNRNNDDSSTSDDEAAQTMISMKKDQEKDLPEISIEERSNRCTTRGATIRVNTDGFSSVKVEAYENGKQCVIAPLDSAKNSLESSLKLSNGSTGIRFGIRNGAKGPLTGPLTRNMQGGLVDFRFSFFKNGSFFAKKIMQVEFPSYLGYSAKKDLVKQPTFVKRKNIVLKINKAVPEKTAKPSTASANAPASASKTTTAAPASAPAMPSIAPASASSSAPALTKPSAPAMPSSSPAPASITGMKRKLSISNNISNNNDNNNSSNNNDNDNDVFKASYIDLDKRIKLQRQQQATERETMMKRHAEAEKELQLEAVCLELSRKMSKYGLNMDEVTNAHAKLSFTYKK